MENFLKTLFYVTLVFFFIAGTVYFTVSTYSMTKDLEKSLTNSNSSIFNDFKKDSTMEQIKTINSTALNDTIAFFKKGLLSQYSTLWSIVLVILSIAAVILGYYGGLLNSGCVKDPVAEFLAFVPMLISFLVLGTFGFVIVGWSTVIGMVIGILTP